MTYFMSGSDAQHKRATIVASDRGTIGKAGYELQALMSQHPIEAEC